MEPFKTFISPELVGWLGHHLARRAPGFDAEAFAAGVLPRLQALELKERAQLIADVLHRLLPADDLRRASALRAILHPDPLDHANRPSDAEGICGWGILPLTLLVGQRGVHDFDRSMELLREMTMRFSSEFGVRHLVLADQPRALAIMARWVGDPNRHVRRLVSEGTRPRLPWAMRLPALIRDPSPVLPLLERLRDDPEDYVRRSVANHLNDIAKDHPRLVADLARRWSDGAGADRAKLIRHALRSLVKAGDPAALDVLGQGPALVEAGPLVLDRGTVRMGEALGFEIALRSTAKAPQRLVVDCVLHFLKANGSLSPKVFKGAEIDLPAGATRVVRRRHRFREVTTRRHYPGRHAISLRINGADTPPVSFLLVE